MRQMHNSADFANQKKKINRSHLSLYTSARTIIVQSGRFYYLLRR